MIQGLVAKKLIEIIIKKVMKNRELKKLRKYVDEPNELDIKVKELDKSVRNLEVLMKEVLKRK